MVPDHGSVEFTPTRAAGLERLAEFLPRAGRDYAERRNHVAPPMHANVSRLSPWVRTRLLREEELVAAARGAHGFRGAEKFIQEVYWRSYWKGWLEQRPEAWMRWRDALPRRRDELAARGAAALADLKAARAGHTDLACFNAWARELVETGWLHNHARMWFASIWIFTLRLPWELGAAFFQEHLLDGDAASNTLSWRWVAGLQTPGKTYVASAENIARYAGAELAPPPGRLVDEPAAQAVMRALAAEAGEGGEAGRPLARVALSERPTRLAAAGFGAGGEATRGVGGGGRVGLWLHAEDLSVETGELAAAPVAAIFAGWPAGLGARTGWSPRVEAWTRAALADGAARASAHFGAAAGEVGGATKTSGDFAAALVAWARAERLAAVLAYEPPTGPWREVARTVEAALGAASVSTIWMRRAWDAALWPRAARGFFPFWEGVRGELARDGDTPIPP